MDFKQLESFVMLSKLRNFSKAAEKLYLTQPTISNHINNLENELKTLLFNRSNKKVTLTPAGEVLLKHAISILNERDQALFSLGQFKGEINGTLEIASSSIPERYLLTNLLCAFSEQYPKVQYNILRYDTKQVIDKLMSGEVDFGIVGSKREKSNLYYMDIFEDEIILIAPTTPSYEAIDHLAPADLINHRIVMREEGSGTRKTIEETLSDHGIQPEQLTVVAYMENTETIKEVVKMGMGISFVSKRAVLNELAEGTIKEIKLTGIEMNRSFYFVFHQKMLLSPLSEKFKDFVLEHIKTGA